MLEAISSNTSPYEPSFSGEITFEEFQGRKYSVIDNSVRIPIPKISHETFKTGIKVLSFLSIASLSTHSIILLSSGVSPVIPLAFCLTGFLPLAFQILSKSPTEKVISERQKRFSEESSTKFSDLMEDYSGNIEEIKHFFSEKDLRYFLENEIQKNPDLKDLSTRVNTATALKFSSKEKLREALSHISFKNMEDLQRFSNFFTPWNSISLYMHNILSSDEEYSIRRFYFDWETAAQNEIDNFHTYRSNYILENGAPIISLITPFLVFLQSACWLSSLTNLRPIDMHYPYLISPCCLMVALNFIHACTRMSLSFIGEPGRNLFSSNLALEGYDLSVGNTFKQSSLSEIVAFYRNPENRKTLIDSLTPKLNPLYSPQWRIFLGLDLMLAFATPYFYYSGLLGLVESLLSLSIALFSASLRPQKSFGESLINVTPETEEAFKEEVERLITKLNELNKEYTQKANALFQSFSSPL